MRLEEIQAAARELPQHQPGGAQRAALRASLLEAARTRHPRSQSLVRPGTAIGATIASVLAAAALLLFLRDGSDEGEPPTPPRAVIQSSNGADFEHTRSGGGREAVDEVVRLRKGRVAVAVSSFGKSERFRVVTGDAEIQVAGGASDVVDVVVEDDRLAEVTVVSGRARIQVRDQRAVTLGAGERWVATRSVAIYVPDPVGGSADPAPAGGSAAPAPKPSPEPRSAPDPAPLIDRDSPPTDASSEIADLAPRRVPTPTEAAFSRGFRALRRGDHGEAEEQFDLAIASGPDAPLVADARYWLGVARARAGKTVAARDGLTDFLTRHPRSPRAAQASVMLGWILLETGDVTGAHRRFHAALGDLDPAISASARKGLEEIRRPR